MRAPTPLTQALSMIGASMRLWLCGILATGVGFVAISAILILLIERMFVHSRYTVRGVGLQTGSGISTPSWFGELAQQLVERLTAAGWRAMPGAA